MKEFLSRYAKLLAVIFFLAIRSAPSAFAQAISAGPGETDTVAITLPDAEKRFVERNLSLLAQKFNINAARAFQVQARLWNNPSIFYEQSVYNRLSKSFFPTRVGEYGQPATQGENIVQINQLFTLAGKRGKQVNLAKINAEIAEYTFFDLMRSLKFQLRSSFFNVYYLQQSMQVYGEEIASLQKTVNLYQLQYQKGNVAFKELVRLKALLFSLQNDLKNLQAQLVENQANLGVLLNDSADTYYVPTIDKSRIDSLNPRQFSLSALVEEARNSRYDLKVAEAGTRYEKQNLSYQKALAVPDIRIGGTYDRNGSYIQNYYGINAQIDLPVFNRNQGNIGAAKSRVQASQANLASYQLQVEKDVWQAYNKSLTADQFYKGFDPQYAADFEQLIGGISLNYQKHNISLLEFIDFYESYKNSVLQVNQLQNDRVNAFEELNYTIGKDIIVY